MSNTRKPKSAKELIAAARLPERTVSICLRGDLVADIEAKERELAEAVSEKATNGRLTTKSRAKEIAEEISALEVEMAEATLPFRLRALKPARWRELVRNHPSSDPKLAVDLFGLMSDALPESTLSPELDDEDWVRLLGGTIEDENGEQVEVDPTLASADLGKLVDATWDLNTQGVDVPKSRLASAVSRMRSDD